MKVVFWAGGLGTRMRDETQFRPKPMVEIGGQPILWHLMQFFNHFGLNDFVIAGGYKVDYIKKYFLDYPSLVNDFTINTSDSSKLKVYDTDLSDEDWNVTVADTGKATLTAGRLAKVKQYVGNETFICTYGDSLGDVDIAEMLKFHKNHGKLATVAVTRPRSRFGVLDVTEDGSVDAFTEKPQLDIWVNSGFFILEPAIFDILEKTESETGTSVNDTMFEAYPLHTLVKNGQLSAFKHDGFYQPIDTPSEIEQMNDLWTSNQAPWKIWTEKDS
jgi:glucose-1-phosphate cytidylyltransferase